MDTGEAGSEETAYWGWSFQNLPPAGAGFGAWEWLQGLSRHRFLQAKLVVSFVI